MPALLLKGLCRFCEELDIGDLYRIYMTARRDGVDYNLAANPADFEVTPKEAFDQEYMKHLFDRGYQMAKHGYPWQKQPPGIEKPSS